MHKFLPAMKADERYDEFLFVRPPEEVIMDIWFALISCLGVQLEEVCSHSKPLQRRGHCPFALLAEMAEHAYGDARREWPEVELPAPTLVVSYSPATLSSL